MGTEVDESRRNIPPVVWTAWLRRPVLFDDAGERVASFRIYPESVRADPRLRKALSMLNQLPARGPRTDEVWRRRMVLRAVQVTAIVGGLLVLTNLMSVLGPSGVGLVWVYGGMFVAIFGGTMMLAFASRRTILWNVGEEIVEILLRHGCCPACGYGLRNPAGHAEPVVRCTECSARWRTSRVGAFEPAEGEPLRLVKPPRHGRVVHDVTGRAHFVAETGAPGFESAEELRGELAVAESPLRARTVWVSRVFFWGGLTGAMVALWSRGGSPPSIRASVVMMAAMLGGILGAVAVRLFRKSAIGPRYTRTRVLAVFWKHGRCPACVGALGEEADGVRMCAGCGAEWRTGQG